MFAPEDAYANKSSSESKIAWRQIDDYALPY